MGRPSISSTNTPFHYRSESNGFFRGPRRVFCFCFLGILTPTILMSVPLLMRFVFYGPASYHLNPSDMRLLDEKFSTTWCEGESIKINTTFTLYITDGVPNLVQSSEPMSIRKTLIVPDDHKEYWGFYLLKGSNFRISTCARHKGGTLLVVKGRQHLEHCAYIGNEDSTGDSDEFSDSKSGERNPSGTVLSRVNSLSNSGRKTPIPTGLTSSEEMSVILTKIRAFIKSRPRGYKKLRKNLVNWKLIDSNSTEVTGSRSEETLVQLMQNSSVSDVLNFTSDAIANANASVKPEPPHKIRHSKNHLQSTEFGTIRKKRHTGDIELRKRTVSSEDGAFEEMDVNDFNLTSPSNTSDADAELRHRELNKHTANSIWVKQHSLHSGSLNDTNANDKSNSESESSFSSSEEALAKCEGIVGSFNLEKIDECGTYENESLIPLVFNATVNVSGYYYFIFGSENEKTDNIIEALFQLEKYEYDLGEPFENCTSVKECVVDLQFASDQNLVISVPQPPPNRDEVWDEFYVAETECKPRTNLYLIFVLTVPLMILACAFQ